MTIADILRVVSEAMPPAVFRSRFRVTKLVTDAQIDGALSDVAMSYALPCVAQASVEEVDSTALVTAVANLGYALMLMTTSEITRYTVVRADHEETAAASPAEITREVKRYRALGIAALRSICERLELKPSEVVFTRLLSDYL